MTATVSCRVEQTSSATRYVVYDTLMDVESWREWMPTVSAASWERTGSPGTGIGGIRLVRTGIFVTRDEIVDGARPGHHAYTASTPRLMPVSCFRGDVRIDERTDGCLIIWTITCTPRIPLSRSLLQANLRRTYLRITAALALEAELNRS